VCGGKDGVVGVKVGLSDREMGVGLVSGGGG